MPRRKAVRKSAARKSVAARGTQRKRPTSPALKRAEARKPPAKAPVIAVGDVVALRRDGLAPSGDAVAGPGVAGILAAPPGVEGAEGIVCSIREIATGKLVAKTRAPLHQYVFEVLHDRTFRPAFSSTSNVGAAKGTGEPGRSSAWRRVREMLREMSARNEFLVPGSEAVFGSLLDGWRVVKVRARAEEGAMRGRSRR